MNLRKMANNDNPKDWWSTPIRLVSLCTSKNKGKIYCSSHYLLSIVGTIRFVSDIA